MHQLLAFLFAVLAGFALLNVPLLFLSSLAPVLEAIGMLSVVIFSLVLVFKGLMELANLFRS